MKKLFGLVLFAAAIVCAGEDVFTALQRNYCRLLRDPAAVKRVPPMRPDGTWADVDFSKQAQRVHAGCAWSPTLHRNRMLYLAKSGRHAEAVLAMKAWLKHDPQSPNWHQQQVSTPLAVLQIMLLLGNDLPKEFPAAFAPILARSAPRKWAAGQNKVNFAEIHLMKGILYRQEDKIREAEKMIREELRIVPPGQEGVQDDFTYQMHGPQLQTGTYGIGYLDSMTRLAAVFAGTRFAFTREETDFLYRYYRESFLWPVFRGTMDLSACGRQFTLNHQVSKYRSVTEYGRRLLPALSPEQQTELKRELERKPFPDASLSGCRYFPRSGYLVARQGTRYFFSVRMCGPGLIGSEMMDFNNVLGKFQGDGAAYLVTDSKIHAHFGTTIHRDWRMVPGTTELLQSASMGTARKNVSFRNPDGMFGGMASGDLGMAAMRLKVPELQANKAWFCFPGVIVCMGSGITASGREEVRTTVEQCALDGVPQLAGNAVTMGGRGWQAVSGTFSLLTPHCRGDLKDICREVKSLRTEGDMFQLWISHGIRPKNAGYIYIIYPQQSVKPQTEILPVSGPAILAVRGPGAVMTAAFAPGWCMVNGKKVEFAADGLYLMDPAGKILRHTEFVKPQKP